MYFIFSQIWRIEQIFETLKLIFFELQKSHKNN